jgi:hypothetical protein
LIPDEINSHHYCDDPVCFVSPEFSFQDADAQYYEYRIGTGFSNRLFWRGVDRLDTQQSK